MEVKTAAGHLQLLNAPPDRPTASFIALALVLSRSKAADFIDPRAAASAAVTPIREAKITPLPRRASPANQQRKPPRPPHRVSRSYTKQLKIRPE